MQYLLNDCSWKLMGHWPNAPLQGNSMETGGELMGVTDWVDARVPGTVQDDLLRAGLIPDPHFERNSLLVEWVENRWWQYRCAFAMPEAKRAERVTLDFAGVDYAARFYLNGHALGFHEGMFDPVSFDVAAMLKENNQLDVLLENIPAENGQLGLTSRSITQKARFGYKWDFCTHMVHLGIWEDVALRCTGPYRLEDVHVRSDVDAQGCGVVRVSGRVDGLLGRSDARLTACLSGHGVKLSRAFAPDSRSGRFEEEFRVESPALWQVNGAGDQPLYQLELTVADGLGTSDEWSGRVGIRSLRYRRCDGAGLDALPYVMVVNGRDVYLKGVNMTPLSHCYGALREDDYRRVLMQARNMGVNLIRVWGGGLIEKKEFYDLCDELGILVWQEFIQSSSGIDNIPSKRPEFLRLLEIAARAALSARRSYTCHAVWSGGNELMDADGIPATTGDENIHMLARLCREYDPDKLFLPTSASGPTEWLLLDRPGRNHDVHGDWRFGGIPNHCDRFNRSDSMLHSEFGCDGLSSPESLKTFLSEAHLQPTDMRRDLVWRHHGEWWDGYSRDEALFGKPEDLRSWSMCSQFIQAEAIRYALEANRRRKFSNAGSFVWQINEPWPNVSCTSLLEFGGTAKMAAYWVKKAFAPVALSARYDSQIVPAGTPLKLELFVHNTLDAAEYAAEAVAYDLRGNRLAGASATISARADAVTKAFELCESLPEAELGLIIVALTLRDAEGREVFVNHLLFSQREEKPYGMLQQLPEAKLRAEREGEALRIVNEGDVAALFVHPVGADRTRPLVCEDSHIVLLPGCARTIRLRTACGDALPEMTLRALNAPDQPVKV